MQYSLGAIYITVLNLPRIVRNKVHNMDLIPGPQEPQHDINLDLLVSELRVVKYLFCGSFGVLYCVLHVSFQQVEKFVVSSAIMHA